MNIRDGFHRVGLVLAVIALVLIAMMFAVVRKELNGSGVLFFACAAFILPALAYGAAISVGWIISGFRERT